MTFNGAQQTAVYNVTQFGASGAKGETAQAAIQRAVDTCAAAGGGVVYFPPGDYTSGTIHLRSNVRIYLEAGATVYSSKEVADYDQRALFFADGAHNISLEGRGTVDGQAAYERRLAGNFRDWYIYPNQKMAEEAGLPLMRAFPTEDSYGHLVLFLRCTDVDIQGLSFLHSPSWTMHLYACERLDIDGVYIYTTQRDGVWADGIDPDGCKDVRISNCTIETGDDALVFYSVNVYGPALPCENITVTNCRLSSASSALKFCDGNQNAIRNVLIDNCVITGSNRGIAFMVFDGGVIENVVLSNLVVETKPYEWFWWGDGDPLHFNLIQRSEIDPNIDKASQPPVGAIRNVTIRDVIARGPGPCKLHGHADSPLEDITIDNLKLTVVEEPNADLRKGGTALTLENARNFRMKDLEVCWEGIQSDLWKSALVVQDSQEIVLDGVRVRQAQDGSADPAIVLKDVAGAWVKDCQARPGTGTFIEVRGEASENIRLEGNDARLAEKDIQIGDGVRAETVKQTT